MDPTGKIALVTGGAQGMGLAIAKELLREAVKGLSICDINVSKGEDTVEKLQQEFGKDKVIFIKTDVSNEDEFEAAFRETIQRFGGLDIVINNAGFCNDNKWQYMVSVNVNGAIQGALLALKYLGKDQGGKGGVLVNTGSIAGVGGGLHVTPIYNATKSAVVGLSRSLGTEFFLQTTGVRVVCVCPGFTATEGATGIANQEGTFVTRREEWMPVLGKQLATLGDPQRPGNVGEAVIHMIRDGKNGSLWVSEFNKPAYEIIIPPHEKLRL